MTRPALHLVSLACACALLATHTSADELPSVSMQIRWEETDRNEHPDDGWVLYKRPQGESGFDAYRLVTIIDAPPAIVAEAARHNIVDPDIVSDGMTKKVLRTEGNVAWVYSYIDLPMMVSDRDVVTRSERSHDPETGVYRLDWHATNEFGPPPSSDVVRLERSSGSWVFSPADDGKTIAVYENYTDIGGSIPAWIINPMMDSTVLGNATDLRATVRRIQQRAHAVGGGS